jgi:PAS domain S-box-containing protein
MGVVGALIIMSIVYFGAGVRAQLQGLAKANSDSVQWSMSQAEVEHLALLVAIKGATAQPEAGLDEVRKRFNIFYSRISTLEAGALYDDLRQLPDTAGNLNRLRAFLDRNVAFIDADDATLRANLPKITADTHNARAAIRDLSLQGISYFSEQKEQSRTGISRTLLSIAVLSTFLFALLCLLVMALNKLNRINQQRALQTELDSSRLSAIVGTSLDAVIVVSGHGRVIDFNGAAEEIFGYSRDDVIGQNMADLIIPDHLRAAHHAGMKRYHSDGSKHVVGKGRIRIEAKRKSGEVFPVELSIQEARGEDGEIFVSYIRDISKEVEAETELRTARDSAIAGETSKARLLAVMSHEMRTPLNGLLGTMELLSETPLTQKQERYLGIMGKSGRMLLSHVNEVLDVSLLDSGNMELQNMAFDLKELIGDVVDSQHAIAQAKGNSLVFDSDDPELLVSGDQNRIRKVIINLVGNAIKFTRNGQVAVELERLCDGNQCEIRVIDNGIGIAEENIERIFEDFTTLDSSYGRNAEGTGLGLGIVRRIVNALDGSIGVESEPGQGSLFWVRLPVGLPSNMSLPSTELLHGQAQATETKHTTGTQPLDILLVEDNEINRTIASEFLSVDGHRVVLANDGLEGIALANQRRFDLILMNISMPDIDGVEATGKIRADDGLSRETPIVALTAHALEEDIRRFKEAGMSDVISKPVSGSTLRDAVVKLASDQEMTYAEDEPEDLIDLEAIQELRQQLGEQKFSDIVNKFCAEMDEETPGIRIVDPSHADLETLAKTAHRLGGSAAVMGASELHRTLKQIEHSARCGDKQMQHAQILDVETAWHRTRALMLDQI